MNMEQSETMKLMTWAVITIALMLGAWGMGYVRGKRDAFMEAIRLIEKMLSDAKGDDTSSQAHHDAEFMEHTGSKRMSHGEMVQLEEEAKARKKDHVNEFYQGRDRMA